MNNQRVNLKAVADRAGVSATTVSRVLNGNSIPTPDTRKRVLEAAEALNYKLDSQLGEAVRQRRLGKTRAAKHTGLVGFLMPVGVGSQFFDSSDDHFGRGLVGIKKVLRSRGYSLVLQWPDCLEQTVEMVTKEQIDGMIFWGEGTPENSSQLEYLCRQTPSVLIEAYKPQWRADSVMLNARQAMLSQLDYLWGLGHRRIAYFEQANVAAPQQARLEGFAQFFKEKNIERPCPMLNIVHEIAPSTHEAAMDKFAEEFLATRPLPTALVAGNTYALPLMHRLQDRGIEIPDQVSVAGVNDGMVNGHLSRPALTEYSMPTEQLGKMAAYFLLWRIKKPTLPTQHLLIDGKPLERASCAQVAEESSWPADRPLGNAQYEAIQKIGT